MDISRLEELLDEGINGDSTKVLSQPRAEKSDKRGSVDGLFDSLDQETTVTETEPPASSDDKVQSCEAEPFKTTSKACKKQQSSKLFFAVVLAAFAIEFVGRFVSTNHFNRNFSLSVAELERLGELPASIALSDLTPHPALDVAPLSSGAASWSAVVIKPMEGRDLISFAELQKWAARNADKLSKGAAVFRGFPYLAKNPQGFEEFAGNFAEDLQDIYLGTSPRLPVAGTKSVFTSAEFDRKVPIPDHAEMSFLPKPPRILLFNCFEIENGAGSLPGGETALIDYAELWAAMDPKVRSRLADKGLRYTRRYPHKKNWPMLDPRFMKSWNSMFGDKKEDAEVASHEQGFNVTWGGEDMLTLTNNGPAFRVHPVTGIPTFHAHIHVLHKNAMADGLGHAAMHHERAGERRAAWRFLARRMAVLAFDWAVETFVGESGLGTHVTYGDGTEIPAADLDHIRRLAWHLMVAFPHQVGDVDVIDNFRVAHSRIAFDLYEKRQLHATWSGGY